VRTGRTKIIPPSGEKTYYHWLENIEPWCIAPALVGASDSGVVWADLSAPDFSDDQGDEALDEVEMLEVLGDGGLLDREANLHCAADFATVTGRFRDDLAALPHPLNHAR
jgi:valyl-tRNA synthetase